MGYYLNKRKTEAEIYQKLAKRPPNKNKTSKYRGVGKNSNPNKPFRATLNYQGKKYYFGAFETEIEAAIAYNEAAVKIIGAHAVLNTFD